MTHTLTNKFFYGITFCLLMISTTTFAFTNAQFTSLPTAPYYINTQYVFTDDCGGGGFEQFSLTDTVGNILSATAGSAPLSITYTFTTSGTYKLNDNFSCGNGNVNESFIVFLAPPPINYGSVSFMSLSKATGTTPLMGSYIATAMGSGTWSYALLAIAISQTFFVIYEIKNLFPIDDKKKKRPSDVAKIFNEGKGSFDN
jgi:hypothetical protein